MGMRVTFHKKIIINGREIGAPASAAENRPALESPGGVHVDPTRKIVVNGREYASVEEMPAELQQVYRDALASGNVKLRLGFGRTVAAGAALLGLGAVALFVGLGLLAIAVVLGLSGAVLLYLLAKLRR
jgi:hypothetical protein